MAKVTGDVVRMDAFDNVRQAFGAGVVVLQDGKPVATGTVDRDDRFEIDIPDDTRGEVEIRVGLHDTASVIAQATGDDILVRILYNNTLSR